MDLASEPRVESDLHLDLRQQVYRCGDRFALVTYTITVKNPGPGAATEVSVRNRLPDGALFYGAQATRGTLKTPKQWHQGTLTWTIGAVDANAGKVIQLRICAMLKGSGRHVNRARVVAATPDPDLENNAASTTYHWR
jgi:uncharacterized repeat protein (TIGR01451 family)